MTLQQQSNYGPCPAGWSRFNFDHYRKVVVEKAGENAKQEREESEKEDYERECDKSVRDYFKH